MSMSNEQVVERSREIKARQTGFDQLVTEVQASSNVDSGERPPVADAVSKKAEKEDSGGGGGCGNAILKIAIIVVCAAVAIYAPSLTPQMTLLAQSAMAIPEEPQEGGASQRSSASPEAFHQAEDILGYDINGDGIVGSPDEQDADGTNAGTERGSLRAHFEQETGMGPDATWEDMLLAYRLKLDANGQTAMAKPLVPARPCR